MKILCIGSTGQVGRSLAEATLPAEVRIVGVARPECDLTRLDSVASIVRKVSPDIVVNAAAYTFVDKAEDEEAEAFAVNADGAGNVGAACAEANVPIIHISTDYVYDGEKASPYRETDDTGPISAYGRSKLAGERRLAENQPKHVILRTSWIFAPFGTNFVKTMLRLGREKECLQVVSDQVGTPTYAPHLADAIVGIAVALSKSNGPSDLWGVYHAAGRGETSWYGLAREVFGRAAEHGQAAPELTGIPTSQYPTPAQRPANSRLDCRKLARVFGITLPPWQDGAAAAVDRLLESEPSVAAKTRSAR